MLMFRNVRKFEYDSVYGVEVNMWTYSDLNFIIIIPYFENYSQNAKTDEFWLAQKCILSLVII